MPSTEELNERHRAKLRDRNLGKVEVRTYPADGGRPGNVRGHDLTTVEGRYAAKLARHGMASAAPQADEPAKDEAPAAEPEPAPAPEKDSGRSKKGG